MPNLHFDWTFFTKKLFSENIYNFLKNFRTLSDIFFLKKTGMNNRPDFYDSSVDLWKVKVQFLSPQDQFGEKQKLKNN